LEVAVTASLVTCRRLLLVGAALHSATVLLFLCAAADLIAGVLVAVSVSLFPRPRDGTRP